MGEDGAAGRATLAQGCARRSGCGEHGRCAGVQQLPVAGWAPSRSLNLRWLTRLLRCAMQGGIGPAGLASEDLHVLDFTDFDRPRWHRCAPLLHSGLKIGQVGRRQTYCPDASAQQSASTPMGCVLGAAWMLSSTKDLQKFP